MQWNMVLNVIHCGELCCVHDHYAKFIGLLFVKVTWACCYQHGKQSMLMNWVLRSQRTHLAVLQTPWKLTYLLNWFAWSDLQGFSQHVRTGSSVLRWPLIIFLRLLLWQTPSCLWTMQHLFLSRNVLVSFIG